MRDPTRLRQDPSGRSSGVDVLLRGARRPQPPAADDLARLGAVVDGLSRQAHASAPSRWMVGSATAIAVIASLGTGVWALRANRTVAPMVAPAPVVAARARVEAEPPLPVEQPSAPVATAEPRPIVTRPSVRRPARPVIAPRTAPTAAAATVASGDTLAREIALIDAGRASLASAPARALAVLETHRREFPRGQLAAEREFLAVEALLAAHRSDDANRRAADLAARYPSSSYAARAARLLDTRTLKGSLQSPATSTAGQSPAALTRSQLNKAP
jgi:hypothetical protein